MIAETEIWQVMCGAEVYQADVDTLKQWIAEGLVHPTDQVRKGNLRWIEAGRTPALRAVFTGEETPAPQPVVATTATLDAPNATRSFNAHAPSTLTNPFAPPAAVSAHLAHDERSQVADNFSIAHADNFASSPAEDSDFARVEQPASAALPPLDALGAVCRNHTQVAPAYICRICHAMLCKECVKFVSVKKIALCPLCGDLCKPYAEVKAKVESCERKASGFGLADFGQALRYPLKHLGGLIGISVLYALLTLGGIKGSILAYVIMFGCISFVIKQTAWGRFERSFVPDFTEFSPWDDLARPLLLGLGVSLVTIGPTIVLIIALLFGWLHGIAPKPKLPAQLAAERAQQSQVTAQEMDDFINSRHPEKDAELQKKLEGMRAQQIAATVPGAGGDDDRHAARADALELLTSPGLLLLLFVVAIGWAFFYYPMALTVAGFTEDFSAVINPLVGLDTIRRMGLAYGKAFLMYAAVQLGGVCLSVVVNSVLSAFDMPLVGNIPARFVEGALAFYMNLVIACVLGLALYKSADRLDIETD